MAQGGGGAAAPQAGPNPNFEGCGKVGQIRCIFFAEFHPIKGPEIRCQAHTNPKDKVTKDIFEAIGVFVIPKPQLDRTPLTVNVLDKKICGYPVVLKNEKYKRNQFMFNVCFVCYPWSRTVQYEPALIKLSKFLVDLELDSQFLYNAEENSDSLQALLTTVLYDLNRIGECSTVVMDKFSLNLKVISAKPDPPNIYDWDVPILMVDVNSGQDNDLNPDEWDLTTQQLLPHMNGVYHVQKIANRAGVDSSLVKAAVQNLVYHGVITIVPIFLYSNVYCLTPMISKLRENEQLRTSFMDFIKKDPHDERIVLFKDVYRMISDFNNHTNVTDICHQYRPSENMNIDEGKLVQFLVMKKILRRVHKYPVYVSDANNVAGSLGTNNVGGVQGSASEYYQYFTGNGQTHFDEICCRTGISPRTLEEMIDNDPNVYILRQ